MLVCDSVCTCASVNCRCAPEGPHMAFVQESPKSRSAVNLAKYWNEEVKRMVIKSASDVKLEAAAHTLGDQIGI